MSKMSDLHLSLQDAYYLGTPAAVVAKDLNVPVDFVQEFYDNLEDELDTMDYDASYDDSMDGDAASALASCGWGTDEDYGYDGGDY